VTWNRNIKFFLRQTTNFRGICPAGEQSCRLRIRRFDLQYAMRRARGCRALSAGPYLALPFHTSIALHVPSLPVQGSDLTIHTAITVKNHYKGNNLGPKSDWACLSTAEADTSLAHVGRYDNTKLLQSGVHNFNLHSYHPISKFQPTKASNRPEQHHATLDVQFLQPLCRSQLTLCNSFLAETTSHTYSSDQTG